jgi:hypothetical protein
MVNALKKNFCPLVAGKYGKLTKHSTFQHHQANEGNRGLATETVRALGELLSLRHEKQLSAGKR